MGADARELLLSAGAPAPAATPDLPVNVNYVYGPNDQQPQTWMAPGLYFVLAMIVFPLL